MPALDDSLLGKMLDEYRVERALGKGGMARVYLALDTRLQRYVALKVIAPDLRADQEHTLRFEREAQSIARLDHPNIVHIFRFGTVGDLHYLAMQYIDGADLERIVKDYRHDGELMALPDVASIVLDISAALDYAHSRGVIHRDVKPGNIMLDQNGKAVLTDFGLALLGDVGTRGEVFGSPHYIAPEQAISSGNVVPQSDLYALGVVLYYMLTGEVPFAGSDAMEVALRHVSEAPQPPSALNPALAPDIDAVVLHCLEKEPQNRYQTGADFSAALNAAISAASASLPPEQVALRHSQLHVSQRIHDIERVLPPLPEVETLPPPPPDYQRETQPISSGPTFPSGLRNLPTPQEGSLPRPNTPPGGALRRVQPRLWIVAGLALGALVIVGLCGLLLLSLANRIGEPLVAVAPDTATPTLIVTPPSSTPTQAPSPTRTVAPTPTALVLFGTLPPQAAFPTMPPGTFPVALPTSVLPGALPPDRSAAPIGSRRLGEFAVEWYCNERGLGVRLVNGDVDWACTNPDGSTSFILQPTDFDQMCRTWYTNPNAFAVRDQQNQTQAYNWSCYEYTSPNVIPNQPSLATPSAMSLHVQATRDWVAFSNDSTVPLSLAGFYLEREGRRIDASAWGRSVLNPGECLVIHKSDELPEAVRSVCAQSLSLPADKREREHWLKGEVLVQINPNVQYRYSSRE